MPTMSHRQTRYFMSRISLFYTFPEMCRKLSVSRPTLARWLSGETKPSTAQLPVLREALKGLIDKLEDHHAKWGYGQFIADDLDEGEEPKYEEKVVPNEADKVRVWLKRSLSERPVRTTRLFRLADDAGFSRAKVYYAAKQLDVIKQRKGAGRGSYSVWRLP